MSSRYLFAMVFQACLLMLVGCHSAPTLPPTLAADAIPEFSALSLSGRVMRAPSALPEEDVMVLFGFSPEAQADMDQWIAVAAEQGLSVIEVAVLHDPLARPFVGMLAGRMRQKTPTESYDQVWLVTDDADRLAIWIGEHDPDHAYAYLLDADHRIVQAWLEGYEASGFHNEHELPMQSISDAIAF